MLFIICVTNELPASVFSIQCVVVLLMHQARSHKYEYLCDELCYN